MPSKQVSSQLLTNVEIKLSTTMSMLADLGRTIWRVTRILGVPNTCWRHPEQATKWGSTTVSKKMYRIGLEPEAGVQSTHTGNERCARREAMPAFITLEPAQSLAAEGEPAHQVRSVICGPLVTTRESSRSPPPPPGSSIGDGRARAVEGACVRRLNK